MPGGSPSVVFSIDPAKDEALLSWPQALPDQDHVLVTVSHSAKPGTLEAVSLKTGDRHVVLEGAMFGQYAASGYLDFLKTSTAGTGGITGDLMAARFDPVKLALDGSPVALVRSMRAVRGIDSAVSAETLAAIPQRSPFSGWTSDGGTSIAWLDRTGQLTALKAPAQLYRQPDLSPSGETLAYQFEDPDGAEGRDIWVYDIQRDVASRLTSAPGEDETPRWMPDARRLVFTGNREGKRYLMMASADGSSAEERLWTFDDHVHVNGVRADGSAVFVNVRSASTREDIWVYSFSERSAKPFLATSATEYGAEPSPDGRFVAYVSDESGRIEVYARDLQTGGRTQVSRDGGVEPRWSHDGRELFFRSQDGTQLLKIAVSAAGKPTFSAPAAFLKATFPLGGRDPLYAVHPDGKRFLILRSEPMAELPIEITLNWTAGLKR
jgi:dipeptidyl aminopeptidase/acylaminoacyl peptidase